MEKSELDLACEEREITISSKHLYIDYTDPKYPQDKWECTLHYKDKNATFEFGTGIGHRVPALGVKAETLPRMQWIHKNSGSVVRNAKEAIEKNMLVLAKKNGKVIGPSVADVLSCLLTDSVACEQSFEDWCSDFGADTDSRKAFNTYEVCQQNGDKIMKLLGKEIVQNLRQKEH